LQDGDGWREERTSRGKEGLGEGECGVGEGGKKGGGQRRWSEVVSGIDADEPLTPLTFCKTERKRERI